MVMLWLILVSLLRGVICSVFGVRVGGLKMLVLGMGFCLFG